MLGVADIAKDIPQILWVTQAYVISKWMDLGS